MSENTYVCPYCGQGIEKDDILFWEEVKTQYTDNIRGDFLRKHGVKVPPGNKFNRLYYRVKPGVNVVSEDVNGYPMKIEDHLGNAIAPADLERSGRDMNSFDDDFDSDSFNDGIESRNERRDREMHNIPMRACPHCHCDLPMQFGTLETHHVAMFGGRAAGKTAYLVNLFQQIGNQLNNNDLGSVHLASESEAFLRPMIDDYEREGTTRPTAADSGLLPILCRYKNGNDEAFIIFYDIAGEGTGNMAYMANHKGIARCESLLLMVDPNMFVGGSFYQEWTANHNSGDSRYNNGGDCCKESLDSFLNQAGELCKEYSDKIKYVVCVVTKMDMLLESKAKYFATGDIEIITDVGDKHRGAVDLSILGRVSRDLNTYLEKEHRIRMKEKIQVHFGSDVRVAVLGVSTSTRVKGKGNEIAFEARSAAIDTKHRIIEPFLVVMMFFGLMPARKKPGEPPIRWNPKETSEQTETPPPTPEKKPKKRWFSRG